MPRDGSSNSGAKAPKCARPQIAQELVDFVNHSWTQFHAVGETPRPFASQQMCRPRDWEQSSACHTWMLPALMDMMVEKHCDDRR
jgi:hypothetical protein